MTSNNDWTPLPQRKNGGNKRNKDIQTKIIAQLKDMFGSTFEIDIIISVAQNCNWKLEPAIDALITLSSTPQPTQPSNSSYIKSQTPAYDPWTAEIPEFLPQDDFTDNNEPEPESATASDNSYNKVETASLCGLKVQYRPRGMENNSDDDADVVIEDESSDYRIGTPEPERVNVCQFLTSPTQCPPKNTFPKANCINTPSPPCTPQRKPNKSLPSPSRVEDQINKGYKVLILMRGAPGSGKTHLARAIIAQTTGDNPADHIFSTDDFFAHVNRGVYVYDSSRIQEAHFYNQKRVFHAMKEGWSPVIVDNTNTQAWEMQQYVIMAVKHGYIVETVEPKTPWSRNARELEMHNTHGVPKSKIRIMLDRYEPNLSGDRLLRMFSLSYSPKNRPPGFRQHPPLVLNSPAKNDKDKPPHISKEQPQRLIDNDALNTIAKEYANFEDTVKPSTSESWTEGTLFKEKSFLESMNLGAIGSERKTSVVKDTTEIDTNDDIENEVTKEEAESTETEDKTIEQNIEIKENKESKENGLSQCWDFTLLLDGRQIHSKFDENSEDAFNESATTDNTSSEETLNQTIDLLLEYSNSDSPDSKSDESSSFGKSVELVEAKESLTPTDKTNSKTSSLERVSDDDVSQFDMCHSPETVKQQTELEATTEEQNAKEQSSAGFGSIFNFIKNSLLRNEKEKSMNSSDNEQNEVSSADQQHPPVIDETNVVEQLLEASSDFQLVEQTEINESRMLNDNKVLKFVSEKTFIEQMKNLQDHNKYEDDESKVSKEPIDTVINNRNFPDIIRNDLSTSIDDTRVLDNLNLITWRESPFPVNDVTKSQMDNPSEEVEKPLTRDCETFTDPYDFNVAFVGGTDDFKVIDATSRDINDVNLNSVTVFEDSPSRRLMLHKGTMTNNTSIFYKEKIFNLDIQSDENDRCNELIAHVPHLPPACVQDIYENLCRRDFDWALDYLKNLQDNDALMYTTFESTAEPETIIEEPLIHSETSSADSSEQQLKPIKTKKSALKKRCKTSPENLALKEQLESKITMNWEMYSSHTLRVREWKNRKLGEFAPEMVVDAKDLISFDEVQPTDQTNITEPRKLSRLDHPAVEEVETSDDEGNSEDDENNQKDEEEEMMQLTLGYEFIQMLEKEFGSCEVQIPNGLVPVIEIRKSMAQELHALWIESIQRQLWIMQEELDEMIAKDAEYARSLEVEEARALEPEVPNLKEIMDMEMALAQYSNDCNKKLKKETRTDLSSRLAQQTLHEMFPDYDREMLTGIFEAYGRNFDETVRVIEENSSKKSTLTMADILKKRKHLIDELHKQSSYQTSIHNQLVANENYNEEDEEVHMNYDEALEIARASRVEARRQLGLRNENYTKAAEACRHKKSEVAAYYSEVARLHIVNMEMENSRAAAAFLAAQAYANEGDTLDLHFLHVAEAKQAVRIFLDHQLNHMSKGERKVVFFITGRGSRSTAGHSRIKPAVTKILNDDNIRFSEANPGMLRVCLRKK